MAAGLALLAAAGAVAGVLVLGSDLGSGTSGDATASGPLAPGLSHAARSQERPGHADSTVDPRWSAVLRGLLSHRAAAWREGRPVLLREVYVAGSAPLARDTQMLRAYLHRGLRVSGVRSWCSVVLLERQLPDRASLVVVDTLGAAVAQDARGRLLPLPRDQPTRHRVQLRMTSEGWRIAGITVA